ncbi:MAG TPA: hypothetical protein VFY23_17015, partial [Candidatus Limnocylindrales bacterium]|nr:hypothetical protein [Candidatus Limnocylindrales bacterium]
GSIAVESRRGVGSRFGVLLPKDPREVTDVEPLSPDDAPSSLDVTRKVDDSSPIAAPPLNTDPAP